MKNTPENRAALRCVEDMARIMNTGYQIEVLDYNEFLTLRIRQPRDTEQTVYPEIFCKDDWYGDDALGFEICTTGYGDHSLRQAQRAASGLMTAINLVTSLYAAAEVAGLKTHR